MPRYVNTVPRGTIGTGNAQVFGENPLAAQFAGQLGNLRRQQEIEAQRLAQQMRENQLAVSAGRLWEDQVSKIEQDHIQQGIDLQRKGINPYGSSPEALQYQKDRRLVQAKQGFRKSLEEQANATDKYIRENLDKLEPGDVKAYHDFISNTSLDDAFNQNLTFPQVRERFDVQSYLKPLKAITTETEGIKDGMKVTEKVLDEPATKNLLLGELSKDPRGREFLSKITGGLSPKDVESFAPDYAQNAVQVASYIQGNPAERDRLAKEGIVPGTPEMEEYISDLAQAQTDTR